MRRYVLLSIVGMIATLAVVPATSGQTLPPTAGGYALDQLLGFPFPAELVAAPTGQCFAWSTLQLGTRIILVAAGPAFQPRAVVTYGDDDGQELSNLVFSGTGRRVVYVRGGDHGSNWAGEGGLDPNPSSSPVQQKMQLWSVSVDGGSPALLADGDEPAPNPVDDRVAFVRGREIWVVPADGSAAAQRLFFARGDSGSPSWSPDGKTLAFVSARGSSSYIAIYAGPDRPIRYVAPSTSQDSFPRWSPDGARIAFVRRPGRGGPARPPLEQSVSPWAVWVGDARRGSATIAWQSPTTLRGSYPRTLGGANLHWAADDRLVFLSEMDGWPHVYSLAASGGPALLLTPGDYMVEFMTVTPDRRHVVYNANTGGDADDIERRHLFRVPVDKAAPVALTSGKGIEWNPVVSGDGTAMAFVKSDARNPPLTHIVPVGGAGGSAPRALDAAQVPPDFPAAQLVTPEHVTYKATDGWTIHAQLFSTPGGEPRKPAIVFVHGGPPRQMLLGWHYGYYYANAYAVNQYLASRGFIVLSVNYRLGIGYGRDFQNPDGGGARGAAEYQDVLAGGRYLKGRADVDGARIGIWGGSYGGYLVALALGRNSDVFAAGVDIHGVHARVSPPSADIQIQAAVGDGITRSHLDEALTVAWESSPVAWVKTWTSPVLLIHGDDDRNVRVDQTVDLVQRLRAAGTRFEEIVIPDDIHDFLRYQNWRRVDQATVEFFERTLARRQ
jgi:dipeptidyl aminopeptidase/acylaminoacyl peptidase